MYPVTFYINDGTGMERSIRDGLRKRGVSLRDDDLDNVLRIRDIEECETLRGGDDPEV